jgi:hypothetical protein
MKTKTCTKCQTEKALSEFYANGGFRDGVHPHCKKCRSEYHRKYHQKNREANCARSKKWREDNEKSYRAKKRAYYLKHKDLIRVKAKQWDLEHQEESWANDIRYRFGLTSVKYYAILKDQGGVCKICGNPPKGKQKRLCVDHDHKTGVIRGLLCEHCNRGLGCFKDDPALLGTAMDYLGVVAVKRMVVD